MTENKYTNEQVPAKKDENLDSSLRRIFSRTALLLSLYGAGMGSAMGANTKNGKDHKLTPRQMVETFLPLDKRSSPEKVAAENAKIKEKTGVDIGGLAQNNGFEAHLAVESKTGMYVLEIGQQHYNVALEGDKSETAKLAVERTIESQKMIEKLIIDFSKTAGTGFEKPIVFAEGFNPEIAQSYNDLMKIWEKTQNNAEHRLDNSANILAQLIDQQQSVPDVQRRVATAYGILRLIKTLPTEMQNAITQHFENQKPGIMDAHKLASERIYEISSEMKLLYDGVIRIEGPEPANLGMKAVELRKKLSEAEISCNLSDVDTKLIEDGIDKELVIDLSKIVPDPTKRESLAAAIENFIDTISLREAHAARYMATTLTSAHRKFGLYVIGSSHNISDNVRNTKLDIGVIRIRRVYPK